jgi:hypothetical protein
MGGAKELHMAKLFFPAAALLLVATAATAGERPALDRPLSKMSSSEIKALNEGLSSDDPQFIKCRKVEETGSIAKRIRTCRTNQAWRVMSDRVREEIGTSMSGGTNTN